MDLGSTGLTTEHLDLKNSSVNHNFIVFLSLAPVGFVLAAAMTGVFVEVQSLVVIGARLQGRWEVR